MSGVIAAVTVRAAERAKKLGAEQALEALRQELELVPRLGVLLGPRRQDGVEVRKIEPTAGLPGLAVAYIYTPAPPPPTVAITSVTPDDGVPE
ncbi:hypothetical protein H0H10_16655 [Streptomyces sp. TRM S81-3]|uniref:Uncharacterized protein n=1 Tax=Streptomyces griseicoloratus TaxID=2752516 RepID=A0A926L5H0_9ACTN|nr:hypothetical protein [Streptomyces griseicoloratus]MBD0420756.1 hypothetical protein [Streptomyces griseicoloratus]